MLQNFLNYFLSNFGFKITSLGSTYSIPISSKNSDPNLSLINSKGVLFLFDSLTYGDADNDAESIKKYFGVTFSNGTKLCKDNAKYISPKFADDGVLDVFNYFSL